MSIAFDRALLSVFLFFIGLGIGGGLYEIRVVYPNWAVDAVPTMLRSHLISSGQAGAARRFWPYVSPIGMLLGLVNTFVAWQHAGPARLPWLVASLSIVIKSAATYVYFAPTMILRIERSEAMETDALRRLISVWAALSPMRLVAELIAWWAAIWALVSI